MIFEYFKLGITGTKNGWTGSQFDSFLSVIKELKFIDEFHHGDCVGVDMQAHYLVPCFCPRVSLHVHPPVNKKYRAFCGYIPSLSEVRLIFSEPSEYLTRNKDIVNSVDKMIACPKNMFEELRSGTWAAIRYCRKIKKPLKIIWPDGSISDEGWVI